MTTRILRLFPTPVIVHRLEDADDLNGQLEKIIIAQREKDSGLKLSNRGGWQSKHDFSQWAGEQGERVVRQAADLASARVLSPGRAAPTWSIESWANISESGHFNMPHIHGGTFWSAVYYVRVGEGEGGQLVLHDPRMPALRMHAPGVQFRDMGPELKVEIKPEPGLMLLFPAWISHSVEPWTGEESRISVAMNIRAGRASRP